MLNCFFWHGVEQSYDHHSRWLKAKRTNAHTNRMQRDRKVSLLSVQLNLLYIIMCAVCVFRAFQTKFRFIYSFILPFARIKGDLKFYIPKKKRTEKQRKKNEKHHKIVGFKRHFNLIRREMAVPKN